MRDGMGPYLVPTVIVGLGEWGGAVARAAEAALQERSPALARACRALAADPAAPDLPEQLRAHLRVSRMAEVIRALEQEGLMRLDPVVSPATHVYLITSDAAALADVARLIDEAAAELKAKVAKVAIVDVGGGRRLPPSPGFPLYAVEPVTAHGLVLTEEEYLSAAVEVLVAVAQPGGSQMLAEGRGTGTLGISWLTWSPVALRDSLAGSLAREALARCLAATAPPGRAPDLADGRAAALLQRLPFGVSLTPDAPLWGRPTTRRLRRAAAVLDRKLERWAERIRRNAAARAEAEMAMLQAASEAALTNGEDGLARLKGLLASAARDAARRLDSESAEPPPRPKATIRQLLQRLAAAESLPDTPVAAIALGAGIAIFSLIWWLSGGRALSWLGGTAFQLLAFGGYLTWRPWRIRRAQQALEDGLTRRAVARVTQAYQDAVNRLDEVVERHATHQAAQIEKLPALLGTAPAQRNAEYGGALSFPLVDPPDAEPIQRELRQLLPDLAAQLGTGGALLHWQDPVRLAAEAEDEVRRALARQAPLDPARAATRAYGDRLALRLREQVDRLLEWSQPLLARRQHLPEGKRWLLWPEGLPCPPVPPEVTVLPYARSTIAVVQVVVTNAPLAGNETGTA